MKTLKPADGRRLEALVYRLHALRRCGVKIQPDQIEAVKRCADLLLTDERAAERKANRQPPPGFGKL